MSMLLSWILFLKGLLSDRDIYRCPLIYACSYITFSERYSLTSFIQSQWQPYLTNPHHSSQPFSCFILLHSNYHHLPFYVFSLYMSIFPRIEVMAFVLSLSLLSILMAKRKTKASSFLGFFSTSPKLWLLHSFSWGLTYGWVVKWDKGRHRLKLTEEWKFNILHLKNKN